MTDDPLVTLTLPRTLLLTVLDTAETTLWQVHGEYCISTDVDEDGRHCCEKDQERMDMVREMAEKTP